MKPSACNRARVETGNGLLITAFIATEAIDGRGLRDGNEAVGAIKAPGAMAAR
ncbi:MAG: hypothetical protein QJR07_18805 [Acetobacteraceae bacterium]|nr:hypothetical protein [Microbispora sp.]MDI3309136.1 hypothetical protein [Acetobacteraceae bacterium]